MHLPSQSSFTKLLLFATDSALPQILSQWDSGHAQLPCADTWRDGYLGLSNTGQHAFYAVAEGDMHCHGTWAHAGPVDHQMDVIGSLDERVLRDHTSKFVWSELAELDRSVLTQINSTLDARAISRKFATFVERQEELSGPGAQRPLDVEFSIDDAPFADVQLLHNLGDDKALLRIPSHLVRYVDQVLPPYWTSTVLAITSKFNPTPHNSVERVRQILSSMKYDSAIADLLDDISVEQLKEDLHWLTGEDPTSPIISRHSLSGGASVAAEWLKARYEEAGADCVLKLFLPGFAPNVICTFAAREPTTETILVSSHYDSRGSFGSLRAPGGDDDGSGTAGLLSVARAIGQRKIEFERNVQFVAFAGEEQGLRGSRAYAEQLSEEGADLVFVIQADMTGFHLPDEPLQLGLPATIGTPEMAQLVSNVSALYVPELTVGTTSACCSDHQSFWEKGFPATQVFERNGPIADPMYHNSGDVSERHGFDFEQVAAIARVEFATLLHGARFHISRRSSGETEP